MQSIASCTAHNIHLNSEVTTDIMWWYLLIKKWNGTSLLYNSDTLLPDFNIIQMQLAPGFVEVTGAYIGFSSNSLIIFLA